MVLLIKGKWGIGKTYFWKDFIKANRSEYSFRAYSYVSLFHLSSIDQIKQEIFANAEFGKPKIKLLRNSKKNKQILKFSKEIPFLKEYSGLVSAIENSLINGFLICFDDIERKSKELDLALFLGLCNYLKEESNCKIIIVLNESEINENDLEEFKRYREKVIDQEFLYEPSIKENYEIIFGENQDLLEPIKRLGINNLRIMEKIKWYVDFFNKFFKNVEPSVRIYFINRIVVISYLLLSGENQINEKDILSNYTPEGGHDNLDKKTEFLGKYNYFYDSHDDYIIKYIKELFFDEDGFQKAVDDVNQKEKSSKIKLKISEIWNEYSSNFQTQPEEFILKFEHLLDKYLEFLSLNDVESILNTLRLLDPNFQESVWWEKYLEIHINDLESINYLKSKVKNPVIKKKIEDRLKEEIEQYTIKEIIYHIRKNDSWSNTHIVRLKSFTEEDYYNWLITEEDKELLYSLRSFLGTFNSGSNNKDYKEIGVKLENALKKVAKIDKLKELRVKEFLGIKI